MNFLGTPIEDTFAEAFDMVATRIIITAASETWARHAATSMTGFATSVIGCGVEAGIESILKPDATPDGRDGISVLLFAVSQSELDKQVARRVGQCVLTCPSTSVFAGCSGSVRLGLGKRIRYFGDGFQIAKKFEDERYWRIPVMDGEFVCQDQVPCVGAIGGGNLLLFSDCEQEALRLCSIGVEAIRSGHSVIAPFPGGVTRSGSKVGSKYRSLRASTNDAFCPTLRNKVPSRIPSAANVVLELVIDGLSVFDIAQAMKRAIQEMCKHHSRDHYFAISAGNYGGNLGKHHFHLRTLVAELEEEVQR